MFVLCSKLTPPSLIIIDLSHMSFLLILLKIFTKFGKQDHQFYDHAPKPIHGYWLDMTQAREEAAGFLTSLPAGSPISMPLFQSKKPSYIRSIPHYPLPNRLRPPVEVLQVSP